MSVCQSADEFELDRIGILIFIDHQIVETLLIKLEDFRMFVEQFYGIDQQIVEIHGIVLFQPGLIFLIKI